MALFIKTFPVFPMGCNCSIVSCKETKEAVVIDPGGSLNEIIEELKHQSLILKYILHTHAHFDHCMVTAQLNAQYPESQLCLHKNDLFLYQNLKMQCQLFGVPYIEESTKKIDKFLNENEIIQFGKNISIRVLFSPGHSPGSVCFYLKDSENDVVFVGDTLFAGSIGRTDLWGGNYEELIQSIQTKIFTLNDQTRVIPGHGPETNVTDEKRYNPFFNGEIEM